MGRTVTWWGHAAVLLEVGGARLLTDPAFRGRMAHLTRRAPAVEPSDLGHLDAVLVSHVHRDHLDLPTLWSMGNDVPMIAPRGSAACLRGLGNVLELEAGESVAVGGVSITATPAVHTATRGRRLISALGYVISRDVYFAGDNDLFDGMATLASFTLALLPIWGWGTSLGPGHLDPHRSLMVDWWSHGILLAVHGKLHPIVV